IEEHDRLDDIGSSITVDVSHTRRDERGGGGAWRAQRLALRAANEGAVAAREETLREQRAGLRNRGVETLHVDEVGTSVAVHVRDTPGRERRILEGPQRIEDTRVPAVRLRDQRQRRYLIGLLNKADEVRAAVAVEIGGRPAAHGIRSRLGDLVVDC